MAQLIRTEPDHLSLAQLPELRKAQRPVILQGSQLFLQLICRPTILAGHEGAPHTQDLLSGAQKQL